MSSFYFLKSFASPFKPIKLKWYIGKVSVGTPYFLPRRWVNYTNEEAKVEAKKAFDNPKKIQKTLDEWYDYFIKCKKTVPKKIGFDFVDLGWKTKYGDYRFEWSPVISFVFFKWQIALTFVAPHKEHYWEAWLYYEFNTDKTKSKKERVNQGMTENPQIWRVYKKETGDKLIDFYDLILKNKYKPKK